MSGWRFFKDTDKLDVSKLFGPELGENIPKNGMWSYKEYFQNISRSVHNMNLSYGAAKGMGRWETTSIRTYYSILIYGPMKERKDIYKLIDIFYTKIGVVGNNSIITLPNDVKGVVSRSIYLLKWVWTKRKQKKKRVIYSPHPEPKMHFDIVERRGVETLVPPRSSDISDCIAILLEQSQKSGENIILFTNKTLLTIKPDSDPQQLIDIFYEQ